ncbi:hypothetical protein Taro_047254 [Colocasia esculenta]|uniref:Uncharacterized protein n=1 Tax=Colocasia esculenta TaxID=4460 RepID=A0A843X6H8_COLES|nr:hypothetical protein [Colocasia esculenta]
MGRFPSGDRAWWRPAACVRSEEEVSNRREGPYGVRFFHVGGPGMEHPVVCLSADVETARRVETSEEASAQACPVQRLSSLPGTPVLRSLLREYSGLRACSSWQSTGRTLELRGKRGLDSGAESFVEISCLGRDTEVVEVVLFPAWPRQSLVSLPLSVLVPEPCSGVRREAAAWPGCGVACVGTGNPYWALFARLTPLLPSVRGSSSSELGVGRVADAAVAPCVVSSSKSECCELLYLSVRLPCKFCVRAAVGCSCCCVAYVASVVAWRVRVVVARLAVDLLAMFFLVWRKVACKCRVLRHLPVVVVGLVLTSCELWLRCITWLPCVLVKVALSVVRWALVVAYVSVFPLALGASVFGYGALLRLRVRVVGVLPIPRWFSVVRGVDAFWVSVAVRHVMECVVSQFLWLRMRLVSLLDREEGVSHVAVGNRVLCRVLPATEWVVERLVPTARFVGGCSRVVFGWCSLLFSWQPTGRTLELRGKRGLDSGAESFVELSCLGRDAEVVEAVLFPARPKQSLVSLPLSTLVSEPCSGVRREAAACPGCGVACVGVFLWRLCLTLPGRRRQELG